MKIESARLYPLKADCDTHPNAGSRESQRGAGKRPATDDASSPRVIAHFRCKQLHERAMHIHQAGFSVALAVLQSVLSIGMLF
jgi:hypothetical protein